ncbi:hypothetical protein C5470_21110 [Photorhabdus stackebrandtii]|uniref:Uncharacterized protein n=1 Tax=Photorhabdus stackebrandtii TaxID=1123042 RepID=A0A7X5TM32_9GAMM|nr:hypothetical protein [Photorhabdus stackebrandtii]
MKRIWDVDELAEHWSLKFEETQLLKMRTTRAKSASTGSTTKSASCRGPVEEPSKMTSQGA